RPRRPPPVLRSRPEPRRRRRDRLGGRQRSRQVHAPEDARGPNRAGGGLAAAEPGDGERRLSAAGAGPHAGGQPRPRRAPTGGPGARGPGVAAAQTALDAATQALVDEAPGADDAYAESLERWLALGGADLDERAEEAAATLGLGVSLDQEMYALSGGQAARA